MKKFHVVVEKSGSDITKSEQRVLFLIRAHDNCRNEGQTEILFPLFYSRSTEEKVSVTEPGSVIRTPTPNEGKSAAVTTGDVPCVLTQVKKGREVVH